MSDGYKRKHESGSEKRKKKIVKEEALKKMKGSLLKYITETRGNNESCSTNVTEFIGPEDQNQNKTSEQLSSGTEDTNKQDTYTCELEVEEDRTSAEIFISSEDKIIEISNEISKVNLNLKYNTDPANWVITPDLINYFSENKPSQNIEFNFLLKGRKYGDKIRYPRKEYFMRQLTNGEAIERDWLIYSPSTGTVHCYICKLFPRVNVILNQLINGFDDWKNAISRFTSHEKSKDHLDAVSSMFQLQKNSRIDVELQKEKEKLCNYWIEVLKRIVAVIKFLSERGLPFRGDNEIHNCSNNGNYLGCIDLIAEFDPFLKEHIRRHANAGRGNVSYLSNAICEEFIGILGSKVTTQIISEIKEAKYYGISIDSTPDISHMDQLTVIIRYVLKCGNVVERFLKFIAIEQHDGKYLFDIIRHTLEHYNISIGNCRSQSYDNASNMSGIYAGVQATFREINSLAEWVPCAAHSLNLVGSTAVECCLEAVKFFGILQAIYTFFCASPQRWSKFKDNMKENTCVVKNLSETRWSIRHDATKALFMNYSEIQQALFEITESERQPAVAVQEAKSLIKKLNNFETALMCVIWNDLLQNINIVNKALQETGIELCTIVKLFDTLIAYFHDIRLEFDKFETMAKKLTSSEYKEYTQRKRTRNRFFDEVLDNTDPSLRLSASDKFRIESFYIIVDRLIIEMRKRLGAYQMLYERFNFLVDRSLTNNEIVSKANQLVQIYSSDVEDAFVDEFLLFSRMYGNKKSVKEMIIAQINDKLVTSFPNVNIVLRIYLSIFGTNAEGERSFSKLKRIKNCLRSTMGQERLSSLTLLSIESDLMREISFEDVIVEFANKKCRKVSLGNN